MSSVYIVGGGVQYVEMFLKVGWKVVSSIAKADLVQFTGGSDVSPFMYGEVRHSTTHSNLARDTEERHTYVRCLAEGKAMAGICRGGQFLNVMCGGKLWQDVNGHASGQGHRMTTDGGLNLHVTSTHHQMMRPGHYGHVRATAKESTTLTRMNGEGCAESVHVNGGDVEVVVYYEENVLCFQPHPEFIGGAMRDYYFELLAELLGVKEGLRKS